MIDSTLQFKLIDKQWFIIDRTTGAIHSGPHATSAAAIKARQQLAQVDVTATADKVSRKRQAQMEREAAHGSR